MKISSFFVIILSLSFLVSCRNPSESTNKKASAEVSINTEKTSAEASTPAPKGDTSKGDIVGSMQGKWQSLDDSKNVIEIKGNDFMTIYDGKLMPKETIEVSAEVNKTCAASSNADISGQNIFMTKGEFDASCFVLLSVNDKSLEYSMIGGTGNTLKFKKI